jgi:hypothetical protein
MKAVGRRRTYVKCVAYVGLVVILLSGILIEDLRSASAANFSFSAYQEFLNRYLVPGKYIGDIKLNVADYDAIHKELERPDSFCRTTRKASGYAENTGRCSSQGSLNLTRRPFPMGQKKVR